nr:MAG TPA: hypothetical protein [Bacteriophage sp.]
MPSLLFREIFQTSFSLAVIISATILKLSSTSP